MSEALSIPPCLCFSLTAHEGIDILSDQIDNIFQMCPGSLVVLHLNAAFDAALRHLPEAAPVLRRIAAHPDVIVNPQHLPTKWGHMFHAHISNINLLMREQITYDYLVTLSSGDLIVRPGLAEYVSQYDAGLDETPIVPMDWNTAIFEDPVLKTIMAQVNASQPRGGMHEGMFFKRHLIEDMTRILNDMVPDWDYDDRHPKEEAFFQTLCLRYGPLQTVHQPSHLLGFFPKRDVVVLRTLLRDLGLTEATVFPVLAQWDQAADAQVSGADQDWVRPIILGRLPRNRANVLRMLLGDIKPSGVSDRARFIATRLRPWDAVALEWPGRSNVMAMELVEHAANNPNGVCYGQAHVPYLVALFRYATSVPVLNVEFVGTPHGRAVTLPACVDGVTDPVWVDDRPRSNTIFALMGVRLPQSVTLTLSACAQGGRVQIEGLDQSDARARLGLIAPMPRMAFPPQARVAVVRIRSNIMRGEDLVFSWVRQDEDREFFLGRRVVYTDPTTGVIHLWAMLTDEHLAAATQAAQDDSLWCQLNFPAQSDVFELLEFGVLI